MDNTAEITCTILTNGLITADISSSQSITAEISIPEIVEKKPDTYTGVLDFTPTFYDQTAYTANKLVKDDVHVSAIQTYEVSNEYGITFII